MIIDYVYWSMSKDGTSLSQPGFIWCVHYTQMERTYVRVAID